MPLHLPQLYPVLGGNLVLKRRVITASGLVAYHSLKHLVDIGHRCIVAHVKRRGLPLLSEHHLFRAVPFVPWGPFLLPRVVTLKKTNLRYPIIQAADARVQFHLDALKSLQPFKQMLVRWSEGDHHVGALRLLLLDRVEHLLEVAHLEQGVL